jgi:hypothetical protein
MDATVISVLRLFRQMFRHAMTNSLTQPHRKFGAEDFVFVGCWLFDMGYYIFKIWELAWS